MTDYERLTRYMQVGNKVVQVIPQRKERIQAYIDRLFDLEDKIESGELISKKEVERLQAENAALRERLEKAVELPRIIHPNTFEWHIQYQYKSGIIDSKIKFSIEAAEACLKELKEKNND